VHIGNAAHQQLQLDVYGEVMDALHHGRDGKLDADESGWALQQELLKHLELIWKEPDHGVWEVRGEPRQFTHSKVMAWVAFDRAVKSVEQFGMEGPADRWRALRDGIHEEVCRFGFSADIGAFVQSYGSDELDASALLIPLVGFLPAHDPRVGSTVEAVLRRLLIDGLVRRYDTGSGIDGLPPGEGIFIPCSFWLADNLILLGRRAEARRLFERLLSLRNDVGLLSEEYDVHTRRLVGNFPQAFSHVALINTAYMLTAQPRHRRHEGGAAPETVAR
jgi:GH15 family glucan-1,4-alpha-glucosidase